MNDCIVCGIIFCSFCLYGLFAKATHLHKVVGVNDASYENGQASELPHGTKCLVFEKALRFLPEQGKEKFCKARLKYRRTGKPL